MYSKFSITHYWTALTFPPNSNPVASRVSPPLTYPHCKILRSFTPHDKKTSIENNFSEIPQSAGHWPLSIFRKKNRKWPPKWPHAPEKDRKSTKKTEAKKVINLPKLLIKTLKNSNLQNALISFSNP